MIARTLLALYTLLWLTLAIGLYNDGKQGIECILIILAFVIIPAGLGILSAYEFMAKE
jgi:putative effector of murein hydrolase LrgA (UPF0299 family)